MTFRQKAIELLYSNGMFREDAEKVVQNVIAHPSNEAMQGRWDDDIAGYPPQMLNVLWFTVKSFAVEWIDENCPQAWFRPLFAGEEAISR